MLGKSKINNIKLLNNKKNFRLDKFIELALYASNGYYLSKKPIGRKFDFITSPEITQLCIYFIIGKKKLTQNLI